MLIALPFLELAKRSAILVRFLYNRILFAVDTEESDFNTFVFVDKLNLTILELLVCFDEIRGVVVLSGEVDVCSAS